MPMVWGFPSPPRATDGHAACAPDKFINSHSKIRAVFTLIELLVVIAIISILAGSDAVRKARIARRDLCNNLRQIYLGFAINAESNDDYIPTANGFTPGVGLAQLGGANVLGSYVTYRQRRRTGRSAVSALNCPSGLACDTAMPGATDCHHTHRTSCQLTFGLQPLRRPPHGWERARSIINSI